MIDPIEYARSVIDAAAEAQFEQLRRLSYAKVIVYMNGTAAQLWVKALLWFGPGYMQKTLGFNPPEPYALLCGLAAGDTNHIGTFDGIDVIQVANRYSGESPRTFICTDDLYANGTKDCPYRPSPLPEFAAIGGSK